MCSKKSKVHCVNIFKDNADINTSFSVLWAKVINELEQTEYISGLKDVHEAGYNNNVKNHRGHNQKIGVSDK